MQIIKSFFKLIFFVCPITALAQSTYLYPDSKEYHFIDRLEIKQQKLTDINFSGIKPYSRKFAVQEAQFIDSALIGHKDSAGVFYPNNPEDIPLSKMDEYNLQSLLMNSTEWVTGPKEDFMSKKPILKSFYKSKTNMLEVNVPDFFLVVNPMLQFRVGAESGSDETMFINTRGINVRGLIAKKVGFSSMITENQERGPLFFQNRIKEFRAVPGYGFYKNFKTTAVDYFDARGYVTFNAAKYIDIQFGYDKNFIGDGYRSLFLSDWGNSYLFLKLNLKIWKINYQNIFMEVMPQFIKNQGDIVLDRKYAAVHHLSMNVTKWLNVGLFESVVFGRVNNFDFQYLNPIIFYRHIEGTVGSPDNAMAGLDFKANVAKKMQFYGQFFLDEFVLSQVKDNPTSWVNKYGLQLGAKYIDALGVKNLDLQVETNIVRPFTYSHNDSVANYTHYNQPLAHPLGANFWELIGIVNYQPAPRWHILGRIIYYNQGLDSAGINFGANIFRDYTTRTSNDGFTIAGGRKATCFNGYIQVSYEFRQNLMFDISLLQRNYSLADIPGNTNTTMISAGVRLNMFSRNYDF